LFVVVADAGEGREVFFEFLVVELEGEQGVRAEGFDVVVYAIAFGVQLPSLRETVVMVVYALDASQ
jgi:hypothetical protein